MYNTPTPATSIFFKLLCCGHSAAQTVAPLSGKCQHEVSLYLAASPTAPTVGAVGDAGPTASPATWWAENAEKYPNVAAVARRLLAVPATSVASEWLFSKAVDIITKKRCHLESSKADRFVFLM